MSVRERYTLSDKSTDLIVTKKKIRTTKVNPMTRKQSISERDALK